MRFEIFNYKSVTSTNDTAINLIKEKKKECGFVHADNQTKGRGTQGKEWISLNGNLFGSLFFHLKMSEIESSMYFRTRPKGSRIRLSENKFTFQILHPKQNHP